MDNNQNIRSAVRIDIEPDFQPRVVLKARPLIRLRFQSTPYVQELAHCGPQPLEELIRQAWHMTAVVLLGSLMFAIR